MKAEELIDFHLHTNYSDGYSTPLSVIKAAVTKKLKKICITDHYSHYKPALNSIDELKSSSIEDLLNIKGLSYRDAVKVYNSLHK